MSIGPGQSSKGVGVGVTSQATGAVNTAASGSIFVISYEHEDIAATVTVGDNKGNTYTQVGGAEIHNTGDAALSGCWYCVNGSGGTGHTATVTINSSARLLVEFTEITGAATSSAVDGTPAGAYDTSSPYTAPAVTTGNARDLLLAVLHGDSASNPATHDPNQGATTGFSIISATEETNGVANWTGAHAYLVVSSTGTYTSGWTESGSAVGVAWLLAFKEAPTGPTINTQPADVQINDGQKATFAVTATASAGSLTYQWQDDRTGSFANTTDGSGATSATLTTPIEFASASGRHYQCLVTDSNGTVTTRAATMVVAALNYISPLVRPRVRIAMGTYNLDALEIAGGDGSTLINQWFDRDLSASAGGGPPPPTVVVQLALLGVGA